ncbi:MAG: hypothetical protein ACXVEF_05600 [Polyangiales bacterium]
MPRKPDDTADYGVPVAKKEKPHRAGASPLDAPRDSTKPGVGVDRKRPPQSIRPLKRASGQPSVVALAMQDHYERASMARTLLLAGCSVELVSSSRDVPADATVLVADFDSPEVFAIVDAMRAAHAGIPIVAWTARRADVESGLTKMKYGPFAVLDRSSRIHALVDEVNRLAGA